MVYTPPWLEKYFLSEFWFYWNMLKDLSISLKIKTFQLYENRSLFYSWLYYSKMIKIAKILVSVLSLAGINDPGISDFEKNI